MKKLLLSLVLAIVGTVMVSAQRIPTNDYLEPRYCSVASQASSSSGYSSEPFSLAAGSNGYVALDIHGGQDNGVDHSYRACQFDIDFPVGITRMAEVIGCYNRYSLTHAYVGHTEEDPILGTSETTYDHTLASSFGVALVGERTLRVVISSNTNQEFKTSGTVALIVLKADAGIDPGVYKLHVHNILFANSVQTGGNTYISQGYLMPEFDIVVYVDGTGTASLVVNEEAKYGTFVVPGTSTTAIPSGVTAYKCTSTSGTSLSLEAETESYFQAGIPYIVHSENAVNTTINYALTGKTVEALANGTTTVNGNDGKLVGVLEEQNVTDGYVLQNQSGNTKFYKIRAAGETIAANRCYLMSDGSSSAPALEFLDLPEVTGINAVETSADKGAVYDMSGRRVNNTVKGGIYIQNGKKVIK